MSKFIQFQDDAIEHEQSGQTKGPELESSNSPVIVELVAIGDSQEYMDQFETEQTRNLTNDQLQRIVFLEQIKVLELQKKKLQNDINNPNPLLFDISGLNVSALNTNDE